MRILAVLPLILASSCTSPDDVGNNVVVSQPVNSAVPAPIASPAGSEPATSASAKQAKALVERYYALIGEKKYAAARKLWDNDGAASGGDEKAFAATFAPYSEYVPKVGAPMDIQMSAGKQHILVATDLHVKNRGNGQSAERSGTVMLRRDLEPRETLAQREWRIWAIDIRKRK